MLIVNRRVQYAVGQGGFHAGALECNGKIELRYVVDCGAMSQYNAALDDCIDEYCRGVGQGAVLDVLFITHAHADHMNGVKRLLDPSSGIRAKCIVMPLLSSVERLLCYAKTADEDQTAANDQFYRDFVVDPVTCMSRFEPEQIILVRSSGPDGGAPFSRDENAPSPDLPNSEGWGERSWTPVGEGAELLGSPEAGSDKSGSDYTDQVAFVIQDSVGFMYTAGPNCKWLLAPYVDPVIRGGTETFLNALAVQFGWSVKELLDWLEDPINVGALLIDPKKNKKLVAAYRTLVKDLNVTSLTIYSGPISEMHSGHVRVKKMGAKISKWGRWYPRDIDCRLGWMGTGDAALKQIKRHTAFFNHYGRLLDLVHTLTLPHHGAENNFHSSLLKKIQPIHCVVAADYIKGWQHPGAQVVQSVASEGIELSVVTSAAASQIKELTVIPIPC